MFFILSVLIGIVIAGFLRVELFVESNISKTAKNLMFAYTVNGIRKQRTLFKV